MSMASTTQEPKAAKQTLVPTQAHVISHAHWDREWYKPFQGFRYYLVQVIDDILDLMNSDPQYRHFHLDGQTVVLEDYVQIRPERAEELKARVAEGRILVGPWYDAPDLFLVDGESLVRNIQLGCKVSAEWGAEPMPIGYALDFFGHSSQMPQIYSGFGFRAATQFRGTNRQMVDSEFIWEAPDGSQCVVFRLCDHKAYSNFWYTFKPILTQEVPYDEKLVEEGLKELIAECTEQSVSPYMLFNDGVDHITANPATTRILEQARQLYPDIKFEHSSWPVLIEKTLGHIQAKGIELKTVKGELRTTNKDGRLNRVTVDVGSSRIYLKIMNKFCETALLRWMEPLAVMAAWKGVEQPRGFLDLAWRYLLKNHPHDSICGCSIDQVHKDMEYRFDQVRLIEHEVDTNLMKKIAATLNTSAVQAGERGVVIFNPSQYDRTGVTDLEMELDDPALASELRVVDEAGVELPHQMLERKRIEGYVHYTPIQGASGRSKTRLRMAVDLGGVPGLGRKLVRVQENMRAAAPEGPMLAARCGQMENALVKIQFQPDGTFDLLDKVNARQMNGLHNFEDCGEVGDLWLHQFPKVDLVVRGIKRAQISLVENGPLRATHRVEYTLQLPEGLSADKSTRSDLQKDLTVVSLISLTKDSARVDIRSTICNNVMDHRLRVLFPSGVTTDVNYASSPYDVVERVIKVDHLPDWQEPATEIKPTQGFVDVTDGKAGVALITRGLPEYAVLDEPQRTIALTLLRTTANTVGTMGEEGSQCLRPIDFHYALYPHQGDWDQAGLYAQVDGRNLALRTTETNGHEGDFAASGSELTIEPAALVFSSLRQPYDTQEEAALRLFNPTGRTLEAKISQPRAVAKAFLCDLSDQPVQELKVEGGAVKLSVAPKKIISLRFQYEQA